MPDNLHISTRYTVHVTQGPAPEGGWRARLGHWLRCLATRVDGDRSLRYRVETLPCLPDAVTAACLEAGIDHGAALLEEALVAEALEGAMRTETPHLYADEAHHQEGRS